MWRQVTQLWEVFDNSPKKLAAYLKVQEEIKQVTLGPKANKRIGKRLKKACKTCWLTFDNAIAAVCSDLPSILQTLHQLKADPSCYGLLKKFMKAKKVGTIYILREVLPVLSDLSRVFQQGTINFAHIKPSITVCKEKLLVLVENKSPIKKLQDDLAEGGTLALTVTEIRCSSRDIRVSGESVEELCQCLGQEYHQKIQRCNSSSNSDAGVLQDSHTT